MITGKKKHRFHSFSRFAADAPSCFCRATHPPLPCPSHRASHEACRCVRGPCERGRAGFCVEHGARAPSSGRPCCVGLCRERACPLSWPLPLPPPRPAASQHPPLRHKVGGAVREAGTLAGRAGQRAVRADARSRPPSLPPSSSHSLCFPALLSMADAACTPTRPGDASPASRASSGGGDATPRAGGGTGARTSRYKGVTRHRRSGR